MKIDEWGLRKYKTSNDGLTPLKRQKPSKVPKTSTASAVNEASPISEVDEVDDVQLMFGNISIPTGPVRCSDLLPMIKGPDEFCHGLKILVAKWQPGGEYLKAALKFLRDGRYTSAIRHSSSLPDIFLQATALVPPDECPILIKALIESDLSFYQSVFASSLFVPEWITRYRNAVAYYDWGTAKSLLDYSDLVTQVSGKIFADCAFIVIAERMLEQHRRHLEELERHAISLDPFEAKLRRKQYIDILRDLSDLNLDVDPSLSRYSIKIMDWNEALAKEAAESQRQEDTERFARTVEKYRQLISLYSDKSTNIIDECLDVPLEEANGKSDHFDAAYFE